MQQNSWELDDAPKTMGVGNIVSIYKNQVVNKWMINI